MLYAGQHWHALFLLLSVRVTVCMIRARRRPSQRVWVCVWHKRPHKHPRQSISGSKNARAPPQTATPNTLGNNNNNNNRTTTTTAVKES